jgi:hypothetical protein
MSDESDLIAAFRKLANKAGDEFSVTRRGTSVDVQYSGGSSSSLALSTSYDRAAKAVLTGDGKAALYRESAKGGALVSVRPMLIKLREETASDRDGKAEGINREHQTGDAKFDESVYVDSPTTDPKILDAVLGPSTREGAMKLLSLGFHTIVIDDEARCVKALFNAFASREPGETRADEMLDAFVALVSDLPSVKASAGTHPERPLAAFNVGFGILAGIAAVGSIPAYFMMAAAHDCTETSDDEDGQSLKSGCGEPGGIAFVVGFIVAAVVVLVARPWLKRRYSGQSSSHSQITAATWVIFALTLFGCFYLLSWVLFARR